MELHDGIALRNKITGLYYAAELRVDIVELYYNIILWKDIEEPY